MILAKLKGYDARLTKWQTRSLAEVAEPKEGLGVDISYRVKLLEPFVLSSFYVSSFSHYKPSGNFSGTSSSEPFRRWQEEEKGFLRYPKIVTHLHFHRS